MDVEDPQVLSSDGRKELHIAALRVDWEAAERILEKFRLSATAKVTENDETALHIAAHGATPKHVHFVENLLGKLDKDDLTRRNDIGATALFFAASAGNVKIADLMVSKNKELPTIANQHNFRPVYVAALAGKSDMVKYLLPLSKFESWDTLNQSNLLTVCIEYDLYGIASEIVSKYPALAMEKNSNDETPLDALASNPSAFVRRNELGFWNGVINTIPCKKVNNCKISAFELLKEILDAIQRRGQLQDIVHLVFVAAELGNYEFLVELIRRCPDFLYRINAKSQTIFHLAVLHRHESIFNLIYEIGAFKDLLATYRDEHNNTILHLAAQLVPSDLPGAALQMQRELLWYKEVERIVRPQYRTLKNKSDQTPKELFTEKHNALMREGEKWMKKTAQSCMLMSTLIATVIFAAAFATLGNKYDSPPNLVNEKLFMIFTITNNIAMFSASISTIMFLGIMTSRYSENEFVASLPCLLLIGITTLFISIAAMMTAFSLGSVLSYQQCGSKTELPISLGLLALVPIMFIILKYRLLFDIIHSQWSSRFLFQASKYLF